MIYVNQKVFKMLENLFYLVQILTNAVFSGSDTGATNGVPPLALIIRVAGTH